MTTQYKLLSVTLAALVLLCDHFGLAAADAASDTDGVAAVNDEHDDTCEFPYREGADVPLPPSDGSDMGVPQQLSPETSVQDWTEHIEAARWYMASEDVHELGDDVVEHCRNEHSLCAEWR